MFVRKSVGIANLIIDVCSEEIKRAIQFVIRGINLDVYLRIMMYKCES